MIKKQKKLIIILSVVFVLLLASYFIFLYDGAEEDKTAVEKIIMFDYIPRDNMQTIEVNNQNGSYQFYYHEQTNTFYIKDNENAPYSKDMFSSLVTSVGFTEVMTKVCDSCDDLSQYGLSDDNNPAWFKVTTRDGKEQKAFVGNAIPTGAGYYARNDGESAVYVLDASISQTVLSSIENLITPVLTLTVSQTDYYTIKNFTIGKRGQPFVQITSNTVKSKDTDGTEYEELENYQMLYPGDYFVNTDNYDGLLQSFQEFYGDYVVKLGKRGVDFDDEILEQYGLKDPAYELFFEYQNVQNSIAFSDKQEDGSYYAYSLLYNIICKVNGQTASFLEWELIDYIQKPLFQYNITDIADITVSSKDFEETYIISVDEEKSTKKKTAINVKLKSNGAYVDSENFRNYYMSLLTLNLVSYSDVTSTDGLEALATLKIVTNSGKKLEYVFYPYSSRRCLYTYNGNAEFYVIKDSVDKLISDAKKVVSGEKVDYQSKT